MLINEPVAAPPAGMMYGTRMLIRHIEQQLKPDDAATVATNKIQQHVVILRRRSRVESERDVADWMHSTTDRYMHDLDARHPEGARQVRCTRGCNACCYQHVSVPEPEAQRALEAAQAAGHEIDVDRLRKQSQATNADAYQRTLSHADRRCVMLKDDGVCAIYADRPIACRTYRVITDPALCDTEGNAWSVNGSIGSLVTPMAEVLVSAAMRTFRHGSFAALLLLAMEPA